MRRLFTAFLAAILLAACGDPAPAPSDNPPFLEVTGLYIIDPPGGRDIASAFMQITATGGDYRFIAASSQDADRVELHTHDMSGGQMQMRRVDGFDISAGETLVLESGGNHLMLFGWDEAMQPGDETELLLSFTGPDDQDVTLALTAEVRDLSGQ